MKKLILCAVAITAFFSQDIYAQDEVAKENGLYFKVNGGYNFAISNSQHGAGEVPFAVMPYPFYGGTQNSGGDINWKIEDVNLGKGISFGGTVGYAFNNRFGAEVEVNYLIGNKNEAKITTNSGYLNQKLYAKMLQIKPAFVLSAGYSKINPYAKFGPIIGSGKIFHDFEMQDGGSMEAKVEAKGGLAFGFHAGLGMNFGITSKLSLFGELNMNNLSYAPEEGKLKELKQDGVSQNLNDYDVYIREYEYTDQGANVNIGGGGGTPADPNQPYKAPKTSYNFGTLGINIGLKYSL